MSLYSQQTNMSNKIVDFDRFFKAAAVKTVCTRFPSPNQGLKGMYICFAPLHWSRTCVIISPLHFIISHFPNHFDYLESSDYVDISYVRLDTVILIVIRLPSSFLRSYFISLPRLYHWISMCYLSVFHRCGLLKKKTSNTFLSDTIYFFEIFIFCILRFIS